MTTFDYSRPRSTAARLIARYGQIAQIRRSTCAGSDYDPIVTSADYPCRLVVLDYEDKQIDGTRIRAGDKHLFISTAGLTITPTEQDQIVISGIVHEIIRVAPLSPAGVAVFFEIQARR